ncbi:hypothetical protein BH09ACT7_BH09ACT7_08390 [soil metagenome]
MEVPGQPERRKCGAVVKMHRAKEFEPKAWAWPTSGPNKRVFIHLGFIRFTATAEEAVAFANLLVDAAEAASSGGAPHGQTS